MARVDDVRALVLEHTVPDAPVQSMLLGMLFVIEEQRRGLDALTEQIDTLREMIEEIGANQ